MFAHKIIQSGFSWYSRWDVNAGPSFLTPSLSKAGANVTVDNVACNLARLVSRMAGDNLLAITSSNSTAAPPKPRGQQPQVSQQISDVRFRLFI